MPRFNRFLTVIALAAFVAGLTESGGATPLPVVLPTVSSSHVPTSSAPMFDDREADTEARKISDAQVAALIRGIFMLAPGSVVIDKRPYGAGSSARAPIYEGKGNDGKLHISAIGGNRNCFHSEPHTQIDEADCFGANLSMAADGGTAGAAMKLAYDRAKDKHEFARALGRALQLGNEKQETTSEANIASMRALPIREKRAEVYTTLRSRKIVVYNALFNPGTAHGPDGCERTATLAAAAYPTFGESLPPNACGPSFPRETANGTPITVAPTSPSATAEFDLGFDLACGYEKSVELDFDLDDRLSSVVVSSERRTCL